MGSFASLFSLTSLLVLVIGVACGLAAGYLALPSVRRTRLLRAQLDQLLQEHQDYKSSVDTHFRKTADLVGDMTRSYAAVYDHLAGGARTFCDGAGAEKTLSFGPLPGVLASPVIDTAVEPREPERARDTDFVIDRVSDDLEEPGDAEGFLNPSPATASPASETPAEERESATRTP